MLCIITKSSDFVFSAIYSSFVFPMQKSAMCRIVMAVQRGGQACQRTSISGLAILLSHTGHTRPPQATPGQARPVAGHSFRPPARARVASGASKTMLLQNFGALEENTKNTVLFHVRSN